MTKIKLIPSLMYYLLPELRNKSLGLYELFVMRWFNRFLVSGPRSNFSSVNVISSVRFSFHFFTHNFKILITNIHLQINQHSII